jgi:hypothetical protein
MANIYALDPFLKKEFVFLGYINSALKSSSSKQLLSILKSMDKMMSDILGKSSQKFVGGYRITKTAMEGMFPEGFSAIPSLVSNILTPSYHYLAQRPTLIERSASLGLRQLAEDLIDSYVELEQKNPALSDKAKEDLKKRFEPERQGHSTAVLRQEERIMNEKPTVKEFYNETLKDAYEKVFKVLDGDKKLTKFFFDYNPDIKVAKRGLEARAVEWAVANREYWGTKAHPTLDKAKTISETKGKEMISERRKKAVVSRMLPILKGKVAETKARKEAEEKARKEEEEKEKAKSVPKKKGKEKEKPTEEDFDSVMAELGIVPSTAPASAPAPAPAKKSGKERMTEFATERFFKLFPEVLLNSWNGGLKMAVQTGVDKNDVLEVSQNQVENNIEELAKNFVDLTLEEYDRRFKGPPKDLVINKERIYGIIRTVFAQWKKDKF